MTAPRAPRLHVLIAPDKFAGTLSALDVCTHLATGWRHVRPADEIRSMPLADGGPGTVDSLHRASGGTLTRARTCDPVGRPVDASWLTLPDGTAVVETATASGLHLVAEEERDPMRMTTAGVGHLLRTAAEAGASRIVLCLGGSATVDGGAGAAIALGARLVDSHGAQLSGTPATLPGLRSVTGIAVALPPVELATDVANALLGPTGAAQVYGPQKGAPPADVALLEQALTRLADVVERDLPGGPWRDALGAGAAGGLGFGALAWFGATQRSGAELVADAAGLEDALRWADVVVTGEGSLDEQSLAGKVPVHVARRAREHDVAVLAVAGRVAATVATEFADVVELGPAGLQDPAGRCRAAGTALAARLS